MDINDLVTAEQERDELPDAEKGAHLRRTAQQILDDVTDGKLDAASVKITETARLTITDMETGAVEERIVHEGVPKTLSVRDGRLEIL